MQSSISSLTRRFKVTPWKVILGLVLLCLVVVISRTALDETKLTYTASSRQLDQLGSNATTIKQHFEQPLQGLLVSLKAATLAASFRRGPIDVVRIPTQAEFSSHEELQWTKKNPCKSREELKLRYHKHKSIENVDIPHELQVVMDEYTKLHRTCIRASGDLTTLFHTKSHESGCKFLIAEAGNGLGNRIMWMVSNLMYAILTQRVLLVDPRSLIPSLMCEPFLGSSWVAPNEFPFADLRPDLWQTTNEFIENLNSLTIQEEKNGTDGVFLVNAARADDSWGPITRFYCPTEQSIYAKVRWMTLGGCLYFLPKLFTIPTFQPILQSLFKDKNPLTHLLRYSMLPVDLIWARIRRVEEVYLKNKKQIVGVHVRYRGGFDDYRDHHDNVNRNVKDCLMQNDILQKTSNTSHWKLFASTPKPSSGIVVLFISSLYNSLFDDLKTIYPQVVMTKAQHTSREVVSLVHLSNEGERSPALEIDGEALVEILCLSFSDALLTSPISTFSQVAQAYGSLKPWIINLQEQDGQSQNPIPACRRGKSTDGCYQGAGLFHICPYDPDVDNLQIMKQVTSLKPCEDGSPGVQFIPD